MFLNRNENAGIKIYILDRESDKFEQRFSHEINNKEIVIINSDIRSLTEIPRDVNYIIHAAATPDTRYHVSCPMDTMTTIAEGTAAMLRAASRLNNLIGTEYQLLGVLCQRWICKFEREWRGIKLQLELLHRLC